MFDTIKSLIKEKVLIDMIARINTASIQTQSQWQLSYIRKSINW